MMIGALVNKTIILDEKVKELGSNFTLDGSPSSLGQLAENVIREGELRKVDDLLDLFLDRILSYHFQIQNLFKFKEDLRKGGCFEVLIRSDSLDAFTRGFETYLSTTGYASFARYPGDVTDVTCKTIRGDSPIQFAAEIPVIRSKNDFYQVYKVKFATVPLNQTHSRVLDNRSNQKPLLGLKKIGVDLVSVFAPTAAEIKKLKTRPSYLYFGTSSESIIGRYVKREDLPENDAELGCLAAYIMNWPETVRSLCRFKTVKRFPRVDRLAPNYVNYDQAGRPGSINKFCRGALDRLRTDHGTMYLGKSCYLQLLTKVHYGMETDISYIFGYPEPEK